MPDPLCSNTYPQSWKCDTIKHKNTDLSVLQYLNSLFMPHFPVHFYLWFIVMRELLPFEAYAMRYLEEIGEYFISNVVNFVITGS